MNHCVPPQRDGAPCRRADIFLRERSLCRPARALVAQGSDLWTNALYGGRVAGIATVSLWKWRNAGRRYRVQSADKFDCPWYRFRRVRAGQPCPWPLMAGESLIGTTDGLPRP